MQLIFEETANRHQCAAETEFNGLMMQCTFSSSKTVTMPADFVYSGGALKIVKNAPAGTFPICRNHEARLKFLFKELLDNQ